MSDYSQTTGKILTANQKVCQTNTHGRLFGDWLNKYFKQKMKREKKSFKTENEEEKDKRKIVLVQQYNLRIADISDTQIKPI